MEGTARGTSKLAKREAENLRSARTTSRGEAEIEANAEGTLAHNGSEKKLEQENQTKSPRNADTHPQSRSQMVPKISKTQLGRLAANLANRASRDCLIITIGDINLYSSINSTSEKRKLTLEGSKTFLVAMRQNLYNGSMNFRVQWGGKRPPSGTLKQPTGKKMRLNKRKLFG